MAITTGIILVLILLVCSALVSGSEVAFFSLSDSDKQSMAERQSLASKLAMRLLDKPESLLATILVAKNLMNVAVIIILAHISHPLFQDAGSTLVVFVVQVAVLTFVLLLLGELMPKTYANQFAHRYAVLMAFPLQALRIVLYPLSILLTSGTGIINKKLTNSEQNVSMDELSQAIEEASDDLTDEKEMLEGIVNFSNIQVKEIMKPRLNIVALDYGYSMKKVIGVIVESGYSRLPVYEDDFDNIRGILYVKDLLPYINLKQKQDFNWQQLIREFYFVPESKIISELLEEFQQKKIHMAIVIDEYGGTSGLVTLEDILEEIVGEITDESDVEEALYNKTGDKTWEFAGRISLNDFCKIVDCDIKQFDEIKGDADSLAGLILEIKGEMPQENDKLPFGRFVFTIKGVDKRRIKLIEVYAKDK
ncbi:MAG: gliding motility-associated protein GldE [Bacteroidales bacterium]